MDIDEYIEKRVDPQISWYDQKSLDCQHKYKRIQTFEIVLAALIPLLSGYVSCHWLIPIAIGFLGVLITVLESLTKLNKYHELWIEYRATCELLKYQKYLFATQSAPYNNHEETVENAFVRNVEQIISSENNQWKIVNLKNIKKEDKKT